MKNWANFRFKAWHFGLLFIIMCLITNGIVHLIQTDDNNLIDKYALNDLDKKSLTDSINSGISFVLFYTQDSDICHKMECNLSQLAEDENSNAKFLKIDIEKYPGKYGEYHISGVPSTLIFENGEEKHRIMGVVSPTNLKTIYKRSMKKNT